MPRIKRYNEEIRGAEWWVMAYEIADWVLPNLSVVLNTPTGEVFQFYTYRELKKEMETDVEEILYKEAQKKMK